MRNFTTYPWSRPHGFGNQCGDQCLFFIAFRISHSVPYHFPFLSLRLFFSIGDVTSHGKLVFTARSEHKDNNGEPFDVFASGSAEVDGSDLVFRNATSYPRGNLEVFISIAHEF